MSSETSTEYLENFLKQFVSVVESSDHEPTEDEIKLYHPAKLIAEAIDNKTPIDEFNDIIKKEGVLNQITPVMIDDLDHGDEIKIKSEVDNYGGICQIEMNAPIPIRSVFDKEENKIYAVFHDPLRAYLFIKSNTT